MIIKTLVENTSISENLANEHGLSLYIETKKSKILFDVGASGLFLENAKKLDVDISSIDFLIISHGHYDHGGGLKLFMQNNNKAEIFLHSKAFEKHYSMQLSGKFKDIGLDIDLKSSKRITLTSDLFKINESLQLFTNTIKKYPMLNTNSGLFAEINGEIINDNFAHEQSLIIEENGKTFLITGCAHNGAINIIEQFVALKGKMPDYVIGGFHLTSRSAYSVSLEEINKIGNYLLDTKAMFYTCHCTGLKPYNQLKAMMKGKIDYLSSGSEITFK